MEVGEEENMPHSPPHREGEEEGAGAAREGGRGEEEEERGGHEGSSCSCARLKVLVLLRTAALHCMAASISLRKTGEVMCA